MTASIEHPVAVQGCLEACRRCRVLVETLGEQEPKSARRAYEAIGPQLRHCLDHFICFVRGLDSGVVDYDARDRNERVERDPQYFTEQLDAAAQRLQSIDSGTVRRGLEVRQEAAPGGRARTVGTNVERELMFLSSHTIHHIAIMTLLAESCGVSVRDDLGVAFSTASYMKRESTPSVT